MTDADPEVLEALRRARTVRIETSASPAGRRHVATIWIVVDEARRVLVRSWRGQRGRWYRELLANPSGRIGVGDRWIVVRAEHASDPGRVESCSRALRAKYASSRGSLAEMLVDEVLPTTLELHPT